MRYIFIIMLLLLSGCGITITDNENTLNPNIKMDGQASNYYKHSTPAFDGKEIIEQSIIKEDNSYLAFLSNIDDGRFQVATSYDGRHYFNYANIGGGDIAFPYTIKHEGIYYNIYGNSTYDKIILITSNNGIDWSEPQTLIESESEDSIWHILWNPAFIITGNKIIMYVETAPECENQSKVGLSYCEIDMRSWEVKKKSEHVINNAGNPWIGFIDSKMTIIYGSLHRGYWSIKKALIENGNIIDQDFEIWEPNIHICDPHIVETFDDQYIISFSYDQRYTFFYKGN